MPKWLKAIIAYFARTKTETQPTNDEGGDTQLPISGDGVEYYVKGTLPYMDAGLKDVGQKEIPGSKHNPIITGYFKTVDGKDYSDETAHCMAFVQAMLKRNLYKWFKTFWAADADNKWQGWLVKKNITDVAVGDVATKLSTVANSKRHVFFILAVDRKGKRVLALESNASNMVKNTNWYPFDILRFVGTPIKDGAAPQPVPVPVPVPIQPSNPVTTRPLAWGTVHDDWTKALVTYVAKYNWTGIQMPTRLTAIENVCQLISIMAKYESSWKPETKYNEQGHLSGVVSRGLMQLSTDSVAQSAYGIGQVSAAQLHDPFINLECAVAIMHYQARKHGVLFNGEKESGAGAYWSVGRSSSGSYPKIKAYMFGL